MAVASIAVGAPIITRTTGAAAVARASVRVLRHRGRRGGPGRRHGGHVALVGRVRRGGAAALAVAALATAAGRRQLVGAGPRPGSRAPGGATGSSTVGRGRRRRRSRHRPGLRRGRGPLRPDGRRHRHRDRPDESRSPGRVRDDRRLGGRPAVRAGLWHQGRCQPMLVALATQAAGRPDPRGRRAAPTARATTAAGGGYVPGGRRDPARGRPGIGRVAADPDRRPRAWRSAAAASAVGAGLVAASATIAATVAAEAVTRARAVHAPTSPAGSLPARRRAGPRGRGRGRPTATITRSGALVQRRGAASSRARRRSRRSPWSRRWAPRTPSPGPPSRPGAGTCGPGPRASRAAGSVEAAGVRQRLGSATIAVAVEATGALAPSGPGPPGVVVTAVTTSLPGLVRQAPAAPIATAIVTAEGVRTVSAAGSGTGQAAASGSARRTTDGGRRGPGSGHRRRAGPRRPGPAGRPRPRPRPPATSAGSTGPRRRSGPRPARSPSRSTPGRARWSCA